ncbi:MAG: hypothetical protein GTO14_19340, partial [Anaerolineales bacterium]|nr:hypothetical protein [Anaerolineales bacterium]
MDLIWHEAFCEACTARGYTADDVILLARAIEGEGAALFGDRRDEVGMWIAHTALNRAAKDYWPDSVGEIVKAAFHGYVNVTVPESWAIALALGSMERSRDWADGALFMLSGRDLDKLCIRGRAGDAIKYFSTPRGHELYFFEQ